MPLSAAQREVATSAARFRVLVAGRRFGKTHLALWELAKAARFCNRKVWYIAPTYKMAKQIAWMMLKNKLARCGWASKLNEVGLIAELKNGTIVELKGADNYDSLRGVGLHFVCLDETQDIKREAWTEVLRPTLSDTGGTALFIGTPRGRNHFYEMFQAGNEGRVDWASWQFSTLDGGNVPPEEVTAARRDLDDLTFQQEYEASFVDFAGRAYYPFIASTHCRPLAYDPRQPLALCFDFNVAPGVAVVCQEIEGGTAVLGEVWIPRNSNTPAVCRRLAQDYGAHGGPVDIFGDATGGAAGSAKVAGSDWDLVRAELRPVFGERLRFHVPRANPAERSRVNAVNARLKAADGTVRLWVDPAKAPHVVRDLEGVPILEGSAGQLDKKADATLTHISDALGYYIENKFPTARRDLIEMDIFGHAN